MSQDAGCVAEIVVDVMVNGGPSIGAPSICYVIGKILRTDYEIWIAALAGTDLRPYDLDSPGNGRVRKWNNADCHAL